MSIKFYKGLFFILLIPLVSFASKLEFGGGIHLPLGDVGSNLPVGSYIECSFHKASDISPFLGMNLATLGLPPTNINIYRILGGIRYRIFQFDMNIYKMDVKVGKGRQSEIGFGMGGRILIPLGDGGCHAALSVTSVPFGIGSGIFFNIPWMQGE